MPQTWAGFERGRDCNKEETTQSLISGAPIIRLFNFAVTLIHRKQWGDNEKRIEMNTYFVATKVMHITCSVFPHKSLSSQEVDNIFSILPRKNLRSKTIC